MNSYIKYLVTCCMIMWGFALYAQNTIIPFEPITILSESSFSRDFVGYQPQVIKKQHGTVQFTGTKPNFSFTYTGDSAYVGIDTLIIQFQDSEDWFRHKLFYLSYVIDHTTSTVYANHDYYSIQVNDSAVVMDVIANDSTSTGSVTIYSLPLVNHGEAAVVNGKIEFTPELDYRGMAYINYVICDSLNKCDNGAVTICVLDSTQTMVSDTMEAVTNEDVGVVQPLPDNQYTLGDSSENGLVTFVAGDLIQYQPNSGYFGLDSFRLDHTVNGTHRFFRINVLERKDNRTTLVDDIAFTTINEVVFIDVQANDVSDNFKVKTNRHPSLGTLVYVDSLSMYKYTPPLDIESIETFDYGLKGGRISEEATGTIYINDGHPDASKTYELTTPINTPIVLDYNVPINLHGFDVASPPTLGTLEIYNEDTTVVVKCDTISGDHFIVFTPGHNYVGPHTFTLEHCVTGTTICRNIDIVVTSYMDSVGACYCMDQCVWAGDVNNDGRVNMKDLLPLAHHLGASGAIRDSASIEWNAQSSTPWAQNISGTSVDLKYADANGDGLLAVSDTGAISANYYKEHSMVPELVGPSRSYAFYLVPRFDTVYAGELAVIDVVFGESGHPIEDMEGVAYTLNFSPHVVYDSTTLFVNNSAASFLTFNSPHLDMFKQPRYRQVDVGIARTNGSSSNGYGVVSTIEFIVEDDLIGFKSDVKYRPFNLSINEAIGLEGTGLTYALPESSVTMYLDKGDTQRKFSPDNVTIWPNPSRGVVNVHLNGNEKLLSASLWSVDGRYVDSWSYLNPDHDRLVMDENLSGLFILKIETTAGTVAKKLHILGL